MQLSYLSRINGIGGTIKNSAEDFLVEEITKDGTVLELNKVIDRSEIAESEIDENKKFLHFVLQKTDWTTSSAIKTIASRLRISFRRFNFAGTKDKISTSTQLVSCFALRKEKLQQLRMRDVQINGMWYTNDRVNLGDLLGNRFTIKVDDLNFEKKENSKFCSERTNDCENDEQKIKNIYNELDGKFPNYFGEQRFGSTRRNTHKVGELLIKSKFEEAAMAYLTDTDGEENQESVAARKELLATRDFATALKTFPKYLMPERSMLDHLARAPTDYVGAFRRLQRNILLMFIHAFQSHLFNIDLSERVKDKDFKFQEGEYLCGNNSYGFPDIENRQVDGSLCMKLIGSESKTSEKENELLDSFGIKKEDFVIRSIPEIGSKGTYRVALAPIKDFHYENSTFKFSLQSGSYATVAMREFLEMKK
ncbi:MAG: tRNA pseudouridine(13) synthase TruD [Candidatus Micrarchaeota archaeon]|nr:tRNA pseudouridine(13) synthase TruD [Candidatus Micrarchaeota archaeon]